jgi:energy-coupling factor transport system ATP-binding protein
VRGVSHSYREVPAVRGVSLSLRAGEVSVLMGRNGCGKTTLLKLLAGILQPSRGRLESSVKAAYVPQDADALLFAPTVREELCHLSSAEIPGSFAGRLERYPRDLSSGERQQLAIAVVAKHAGLLLLDEPTRGLDPSVKQTLTAFLQQRAAAGASVLVATHDVEWAARTASRVLLMADGEIYADGPPRTVLSESLVFSTQINKLLGHGWLLPEEVPV